MADKLLIIDDSPTTLALFDATLSDSYTILTANDTQSALELYKRNLDTNLVLSDLFIGEENGLQLIEDLMEENALLTAILITGQANLNVAQTALNSGLIHRFTTKDVDIATLKALIGDCQSKVRQKSRDIAIVEQSMSGFVTVLLDLFHSQIPDLTPKCDLLRNYVTDLSTQFDVKKKSQLRLAASLLWIGFLKLNPNLIRQVTNGYSLSETEWKDFQAHSQMTCQLVQRIPRLGEVAKLIKETFQTDIHSPGTSLNAKLLRLCNDAVWLESKLGSRNTATTLEEQADPYMDSDHFHLSMALANSIRRHAHRETSNRTELVRPIRNLLPGDRLLEDIACDKGTLLLSKGCEISYQTLEHLRMMSSSKNLENTVRILRESL